MKARLATEIGTRAVLRVYWGEDCPNSLGTGKLGYHNAEGREVGRCAELGNWDLGGKVADYLLPDEWPAKCDHCPKSWTQLLGAEILGAPPNFQIFRSRVYDTPTGKLEPGCLYFASYYDCAQGCPHRWSNCDGRHLLAILPNGGHWDIDGRANNCTLPQDTTHRCWVRTGEPPNVTVGKNGLTCGAGAGSILVPGYHGFLQNGEFTP